MKNKKHLPPAKKLTQKEWAKIDEEYSEDMNAQIEANKKDLDNWVNIEYKGVTIPLTNEEVVAWNKLSRADKRAMADSIKKKIQSGQYEYVRYESIKLIRPTQL